MASDSLVSIVVTLTPHPDKLDRMLIVITQCIDILKEAIRIVRNTEPGNLRYHLNVEMKGDRRGESIVFLEDYENQAAWDNHCQGEAYDYMTKTFADEDILAKTPSLVFIKPLAGWTSR
ncbi:MAG: hypothetical protein Q9173_001858 [Seirophora scorigena]